MKLFAKYLKQNMSAAVALVVFSSVFALVFSLYDLQAEAVLYAFLLCLLAGALIISVNFYLFRRKHRELKRIIGDVCLLSNDLPEPKNLIESDYSEIITELNRLRNEEIARLTYKQSESVDYFTAWAHQIKTPIAAMKLMLQSGELEERGELLSELFSVEKYTEMALSYLRLNSEANDLILKECRLDGIIRSAIRAYAPIFIRKKIGIKYDGTDATALTDEKWLTFIIEQLLSNALKYTDSGYAEIRVSEDKIISVRDTGIGISPEDLPRIFEKGFTGYNGHSDKKSTGLGLYLCKRAADKLSHKIYAESDLNNGSTFYIDLKTRTIEFE